MTVLAGTSSPARRRAALSAATVLTLSAAGVLVAGTPASAVDPVIAGHVTMSGAASPVTIVLAWLPGATGFDVAREAEVEGDGTFELDGLTPGQSYQLEFLDGFGLYASGYYTGGSLAPLSSGAKNVAVGTTNVELAPTVASTIRGTIAIPDGESLPSDIEGPYALEPATQRPVALSVFSSPAAGAYTLGGVTAGVKYDVVLASDIEDDAFSGYFYAGPTSPTSQDASHAVAVAGGATGVDLYFFGTTSTSAPVVSGTAKVGEKLTATAGTWDQPGTASYQWLSNGAAISGATKPTYTLAGADYGKKVSVRVVEKPSAAGYAAGAATSNTTAAVAVAAAPALKSAPKISGTIASNHKLTASAGSWSLPGVTASYQWLRSGKAISGATAKTYAVSTADVGKKLSVRVTAKVLGHTSATATSGSTKTVAKGKATVTEALSTTKAKAGKIVKVTVKVKATGLTKPTGTVTVKVGSKSVTKTLKASAHGRITITLPKLSTKATYKVTATFAPAGSSAKVVAKATSSTAKLRVV